MAAGGLVPSQTYKHLVACADNTVVIFLRFVRARVSFFYRYLSSAPSHFVTFNVDVINH